MTETVQSVPAVFGRRLQREREARRWSLREAAEKCGVSASTINRAEAGRDIALSHALQIAMLYGLPLGVLLAESACETCDGTPPAGFICAACKQEGTSAA